MIYHIWNEYLKNIDKHLFCNKNKSSPFTNNSIAICKMIVGRKKEKDIGKQPAMYAVLMNEVS